MTDQEKRELMIAYAKFFVGNWYRWGGDDPSGFDCSGFVIEVYKAVGFLPRNGDWTAKALSHKFNRIKREEVEAGDLVFWQSSTGWVCHVEMCLNKKLSIGASGGGSKTLTIEDAVKQNAFIKIRPIDSRSGIWGFTSPFNG
ncbi:MAG: C40 family peptidase [Desulfobacterales bacterium]